MAYIDIGYHALLQYYSIVKYIYGMIHHATHQLHYKILHTIIYQQCNVKDNSYILHMRYKNEMNKRKNKIKN